MFLLILEGQVNPKNRIPLKSKGPTLGSLRDTVARRGPVTEQLKA